MSKTWKAVLLSGAFVLVMAGALIVGFTMGRGSWPLAWSTASPYGAWGDMMGPGATGFGGMMGWGMIGSEMQGGGRFGDGAFGWHGSMMDGFGGWGGAGHPGMMQGYLSPDLAGVQPIEIEEAERAADDYILASGYEGLQVGEVMIFENHGYVQVIENATGIGAFELLVDPTSGLAFPEYGPNMMWNLKYGSMHGPYGMMGSGMMGSGMMGQGMMGSSRDSDLESEMNISADQAVELAQGYLDGIGSNLSADDEADEFYGYYTIHTLLNGEVAGMLSVNGLTGAVFPHTWHGGFVEMSSH